MSEPTSFHEEVIKQIGYYVYLLVDPRDKSIFYVGKGRGNRVFQHEIEAGVDDDDHYMCNEKKIQKIREIQDVGLEVERYLLRYGLDEKEAYTLESAVIDLLSSDKFVGHHLLNAVSGHGSKIFGLQNVKNIEDAMSRGEIDLENVPDKVISININSGYYDKGAYEAVRGNWNLSKERADRADYVLADFKGIVVGVFKPNEKGWQPVECDPDKAELNRNWYAFEGEEVTDPEILDRYLHKKVVKSKGSQNPIRYSYK